MAHPCGDDLDLFASISDTGVSIAWLLALALCPKPKRRVREGGIMEVTSLSFQNELGKLMDPLPPSS